MLAASSQSVIDRILYSQQLDKHFPLNPFVLCRPGFCWNFFSSTLIHKPWRSMPCWPVSKLGTHIIMKRTFFYGGLNWFLPYKSFLSRSTSCMSHQLHRVCIFLFLMANFQDWIHDRKTGEWLFFTLIVGLVLSAHIPVSIVHGCQGRSHEKYLPSLFSTFDWEKMSS